MPTSGAAWHSRQTATAPTRPAPHPSQEGGASRTAAIRRRAAIEGRVRLKGTGRPPEKPCPLKPRSRGQAAPVPTHPAQSRDPTTARRGPAAATCLRCPRPAPLAMAARVWGLRMRCRMGPTPRETPCGVGRPGPGLLPATLAQPQHLETSRARRNPKSHKGESHGGISTESLPRMVCGSVVTRTGGTTPPCCSCSSRICTAPAPTAARLAGCTWRPPVSLVPW
mmetsp:Transcript_26783/g.66645  ORF Transcript_26783/g.66645 Transcript_26783/m.66645 type:complete len:224 (+) Transcript_26783:1061-1732(+)